EFDYARLRQGTLDELEDLELLCTDPQIDDFVEGACKRLTSRPTRHPLRRLVDERRSAIGVACNDSFAETLERGAQPPRHALVVLVSSEPTQGHDNRGVQLAILE